VAALRALEGTMEVEGGPRAMHADLIAREARITLAQLPADLRDSIKRIRIFGPRDMAQRLADEIRPRFEPGGLTVELVSTYPPNEFERTIPSETAVSGAFSLAARQLTGRSNPFEFLPPKVSAWQRLTTKYTSGKLGTAGAAAAAVLLVVIALFGYQQWQLSRLQARWDKMSAEVQELKNIDEQIAKYRPWFDTSFHYLKVLKYVTQAFPETGSVTAKSIEIRDWNTVSLSGTAQNNTVIIDTNHKLGALKGVTELLPSRVQGKPPAIQFTFDFKINTQNANEN
jgi:hypothetical protein